jgi:hypothetical protein
MSIDLSFAIYNVIIPNSYVTVQKYDAGTYFVPAGAVESVHTSLTPFCLKVEWNFHISNIARDAKKSGDSYAEIVERRLHANRSHHSF